MNNYSTVAQIMDTSSAEEEVVSSTAPAGAQMEWGEFVPHDLQPSLLIFSDDGGFVA